MIQHKPMNYTQTRRTFTQESIKKGALEITCKKKLHHLLSVLRVRVNDYLRIFNSTDGEWISTVSAIHSKKQISLEVIENLREAENCSNISIAFSPIKPDRLRFLIEKCTEIGVNRFIPVITSRSITRRLNEEKVNSYIAGAVEQSERIRYPSITPACSLKNFIATFSNESIIFCNEKDNSLSIDSIQNDGKSRILFIGPEGGFSDEEINSLMMLSNIHSVFLTQNILRAETAAIFALSKLTRCLT